MKERPIIFSGPMDRKTQTRRIVKLPKGCHWCNEQTSKWDGWYTDGAGVWHVSEIPCRYGVPGDRLWVREAFCTDYKPFLYRASATSDTYGGERIRWKPSIHMPRKWSRITLEIVSTRRERLQDISEEDANAEGVRCLHGYSYCTACQKTPCQLFGDFWNSIHGPESWASNPWVDVIGFKKVTA